MFSCFLFFGDSSRSMTKNPDGENICSRMERLIEEYEQAREPDSTEIGRQFAHLQRLMIENKDICPSIEGGQPCNRQKNRYKDVLPYDKYRVILQSDNESDYINASFIEDIYNDRRYIAAQGPIDESITDFIRMIWEFQITSVVCTANEIEAGRFKFRRYWPEDEKSTQFGPYRISRDETSDKAYSCNDYEIRPLIITQGENRRHILLYHLLHWLDHDVPNDEASILELLIKLYEDRSLSPDTPILVHCSAGCGRTGSIIATDLLRLLMRDERLFLSNDYHPYPILKIATFIRQFRIALIQTIKQYVFVHKMFVYMLKVNGNSSLCSSINNDENQILQPLPTSKASSPSSISSFSRRPPVPFPIKLRNPPVGRRSLNGTTHPSQTVTSSMPDQSPLSDQPPPIPPRYSLLNTTNKCAEGQFVRAGEIPVKAKRTIFRSRNVKPREANTAQNVTSTSRNSRSDSADALSIPSSEYGYRNSTRRLQVQIEQGANSD